MYVMSVVFSYICQIDILVNNAARTTHGLIKNTSLEMDREVIELLVLAQISLTKAVLPHFVQQKAGHIVITSSLLGKVGKLIKNIY